MTTNEPMTTDVVFRTAHSGPDKGEVFALFPGLPGTNDPSTCLIYTKVDQHSSADTAWCIRLSRPATPEESKPLAKRLEGYGYTLRPVLRCTRHHHRARASAIAYLKSL